MKGNAEGPKRVEQAARSSRRSVGLAVIVVAGALVLAACGSGPSSPHVASLGKTDSSGGRSTTTTVVTGDPTRLLDEWAACMRSHGDPNQADPTIDANKDINVNWNPAITGGIDGTNKGGQGNAGPGQYCRAFISAAQTALGGNRQQPQSDQATLEKFSQCMRANGISDFPDPTNGTLSFNLGAGGDLNPRNATFQSASTLCARRTGAVVPGTGGTPPPGVIRLDGAGPLP
jgi:hypothetical protein